MKSTLAKTNQIRRNKTARVILTLSVLGFAFAYFVQLPDLNAWFTSNVHIDSPSKNVLKMANQDNSVGFTAELEEQTAEILLDSSQTLELSGVLSSAHSYSDAKNEMERYLDSDSVTSSTLSQGHVVKVRYDFIYSDAENNFPEVFVRFKSNTNQGNALMINGAEQLCIQSLSYFDSNGIRLSMPRLNLFGEDAFYYPAPIMQGDRIALEYVLFFSEAVDPNSVADCLDYEVIQATNNACVFKWNVQISDGVVEPYDYSSYVDEPYGLFDFDLTDLTNTSTSDTDDITTPDETENSTLEDVLTEDSLNNEEKSAEDSEETSSETTDEQPSSGEIKAEEESSDNLSSPDETSDSRPENDE